MGYIPVPGHSGTTAERPTENLGVENAGYYYFDTTLGKPIWWTGAAWVTGDGVAP